MNEMHIAGFVSSKKPGYFGIPVSFTKHDIGYCRKAHGHSDENDGVFARVGL